MKHSERRSGNLEKETHGLAATVPNSLTGSMVAVAPAVVSAAFLERALPVIVPAETIPVEGMTTKMVPLASLHANCIERLIKHRRRGGVVRNIRGKMSRVSTLAADTVAATPSKARMVKRMAEVGKLVRAWGFEEQSPGAINTSLEDFISCDMRCFSG